MDGLKKLVQPTQPITYKTKTNRNLVSYVFPRLSPSSNWSMVLCMFIHTIIITGQYNFLQLILDSRHSIVNRGVVCWYLVALQLAKDPLAYQLFLVFSFRTRSVHGSST